MTCARISLLALSALFAVGVAAQEAPKPDDAAAKQATKPPVLSPTLRLQAAKTAYVKRVEGSSIGSDTVTQTLEGWGRYKLVDSGEKADLIVEVTSPDEGSSGVSVSSSTSGPSRTGDRAYEQSSKSSRELSTGGGPMRVAVRDAKTNTTLFVASEQVKGAMKKNTRENNLVEAAQRIMAKFHERVEPIKATE